jgi:hypothetical protein
MTKFVLLALLLYPDGHTVTLKLSEPIAKQECQIAEQYALTQLPQTLSIAKLVATLCHPQT